MRGKDRLGAQRRAAENVLAGSGQVGRTDLIALVARYHLDLNRLTGLERADPGTLQDRDMHKQVFRLAGDGDVAKPGIEPFDDPVARPLGGRGAPARERRAGPRAVAAVWAWQCCDLR